MTKTILLKTLTVLSCVLVSMATVAQSYYKFTKANEPYVELTGGTLLTNSFTVDNYIIQLPHPIKTFDKLSGAELQIGKNAYITTTGPTHSFAYDPLTMSLSKNDNTSSLTYSITPTTNNDTVVTVQWKNMKLDSGNAGDYTNMQCKIYFNSGTVEFFYGPSVVTSPKFADSSLDNLVGVFFLSQNFNIAYDYNWVYGDANNPKVSHNPQQQVWLQGLPANGTVYRFSRIGTTGISPITNNLFSVYPNPASTSISVSSPTGNAQKATVYNTIGQTMLATPLSALNQDIDISSLPAGIYFITIDSPAGQSSHKFIKQ
jgi:hypothetical protein